MAKKKGKKIWLVCKLCGTELLSQNGMHYHMKSKHPKEPGCRKGVNWDYVKDDTLSKAKPKKPQQRIATPNMQYIEVPAIIRIPISMGPIQIVSIGD